jgi:hypothetical protein
LTATTDGDHFVFAGDSRYIFVYQISTDEKFNVFDTGTTSFDSLYITPQNNVIVSWYPSGTVRFTGQELFDINMNFLRQVGRADGHKQVTRDTDGSEDSRGTQPRLAPANNVRPKVVVHR